MLVPLSDEPDDGNAAISLLRSFLENVSRQLVGEESMTKAKARQRAKAKAAQKVQKREASADQPERKNPSEEFEKSGGSIKSPFVNANTKPSGGARRGAPRSR